MNEQENPLLKKSYAFAVSIVKLYEELMAKKRYFRIADQVIKSGTSIGANSEEANGAQTRKDFYSKISIAYKEARETHFWLRLIRDSKIIDINTIKIYLENCEELIRLLGKIRTTTKKHLNEKNL